MKLSRTVLVLCGLMVIPTLQAEDWLQWRGPQRDGISSETGLLKQWPVGGPKLVWQASDLGVGYSTPAVADNRLFVIGSEGLNNEFVRALSTEDGTTLWSVRIGDVGNPDQQPPYPGARSTTTIDGDVLYALGSDGDLVCMETEGGAIRWQTNLRTDFGGEPGIWAYSESPLVDGDVVVCSPGGADATLVAFNKVSGEVVWKSPLPEADQAGYASIVIAEIGGKKQYVQFLQKGVVGVEAATGKLLWRYDRTAEGSPANIPTPVVKDNLVFTATNRGGAALVRIENEGDTFRVEEVYYSARLPTALGGTVLWDGHLYGTSNQAVMCVELSSGEIQWEERGIGPGSFTLADGHFYQHGENGEVALIEATSEAYREKGRFTPPGLPERGRSKAWSHPVIANGRLYIQDYNTVWCFDIAGDSE